MDHSHIAEYWNNNAEQWFELSEQGFDVLRNEVNTPAFLDALPDISKLSGLEVGCGDGHNTRIIAKRCEHLTAIDISETFLQLCRSIQKSQKSNIIYENHNVIKLPYKDNSFDFCVATMAMMDINDQEKAIDEIHRVLKPGGFFQFSILHPCFDRHAGKWLLDNLSNEIGFVCQNYFKEKNGEIDEWMHRFVPSNMQKKMKKFKVPRFTRTLSYWLNLLAKSELVIEQCAEPYANEDAIKRHPQLIRTKVIPHSLIIRCRKLA